LIDNGLDLWHPTAINSQHSTIFDQIGMQEHQISMQNPHAIMHGPVITPTVRTRLDFGKIPVILDIPNLIEVQQKSYERFLQLNIPPEEREDAGLQEIFKSVFPISDYNDLALLEFVSYSFGKPKYSATECRERGMTYSIPLKVTVRLVTWDIDPDTHSKSIRDIKEQDIYFGEIPMMTPKGTFIINGTERTVVSQMHRSPGVFFDHDKGKGHFSGKILYSCRVIPYRGSWLEFEFDYRDYLYVRIDKKRKILVSSFLRALHSAVEEAIRMADEAGEPAPVLPDLRSTESILRCFYDTITFSFDDVDKTVGDTCSVILDVDLKVSSPDALSEFLRSYLAAKDIVADDGTVIIRQGKKITKKVLRLSKANGIPSISVTSGSLIGAVAASDVIDPESGEVLLECNDEITQDSLARLYETEVTQLQVFLVDKSVGGDALSNTFMKDTVRTKTESLLDIYRTLRPGDPPTEESAVKLFQSLFFNSDRYDLSKVGRLKINEKLRLDKSIDQRTLDVEDLLAITHYMLKLRMGEGEIDDIDHLGNRRVRSVGELREPIPDGVGQSGARDKRTHEPPGTGYRYAA
jgi:DNA-directed RNA polymerase subunit beta